jgi:hypothetical protein
MLKEFFTCIAILNISAGIAQNKSMLPVNDLIKNDDSAWNSIKLLIDSAMNKVIVLPSDIQQARNAIYTLQMPAKTPIGTIVFKTGGLLINNGWIRILGSGSNELNRTLAAWNKGKTVQEIASEHSFLLIADDVIGGFFAINGGALGKDINKVYYLSPDNLVWEPLKMNYVDFLLFCFNGDLDYFYKDLMWGTFKKDISKVNGNNVFNFMPPLWSTEGKNIEKNERSVIPVNEQYEYNMGIRKQLKIN